jgi:hypothetical protein
MTSYIAGSELEDDEASRAEKSQVDHQVSGVSGSGILHGGALIVAGF